MDISTLGRLAQPLVNRVRLLLARGVVRLVDDAAKVQTLQVGLLADETRGAIERFQEYGFTSVPLPGMEAAVLFIGGNRAHGIAVAIGDRLFRLQGLEPGEVALYTDEGDSLVFKRGRRVELTTQHLKITAPGSVLIETGSFDINQV